MIYHLHRRRSIFLKIRLPEVSIHEAWDAEESAKVPCITQLLGLRLASSL